MMWVTSTLRTPVNEDLGTLAEYDPLTERTVFQYLHEDRSSTSAERDGQETELVS